MAIPSAEVDLSTEISQKKRLGDNFEQAQSDASKDCIINEPFSFCCSFCLSSVQFLITLL